MNYGILASKQFIDCADAQLTEIFIKQTGIKPNKHVCFSVSEHYVGAPIYTTYIVPNTNLIGRKLQITLYVNHNWNPVTIYWKSKIGRDYELNDTNIDGDDIEFWFERLDVDLYRKQLYPNDKLPFKLKDLTFELEVVRLNLDCTIAMTLKAGFTADMPAISKQVQEFIAQYNEQSEKKQRRDGVIHNIKTTIESEDRFVNEVDVGSVGILFFKKLLVHLSKMKTFSKIVID
jgi:hypothetical protein